MGNNASSVLTGDQIKDLLIINDDKKIELNFEFSKLTQLPKNTVNLKDIQVLNLKGNYLTSVPAEIGQLKSITHLILASNRLSYLPEELVNCNFLEVLNLEHNKLSSLPDTFALLAKLWKVNIQNNAFKVFPPVLVDIPSIKWLNISCNPLLELPSTISRMKNLATLQCQQCRLKSLPEEFCALQTLVTLNIKSNNIEKLPTSFDKLTSLQKKTFGGIGLMLEDNPFKVPPKEVCARGPEAIFSYMKDMRSGKVDVVQRLKLVLIGQHSSGKSTLARALTRDPKVKVKRKTSSNDLLNTDFTAVLDKYEWKVDDRLRICVNDIGGHDMYTALHPMFLTSDALYLVVVDLKHVYPSLNFSQYLGSWLDLLNARVPGACALLVGTHSDLLSPKDLSKKCEQLEKLVVEHELEQLKDIRRQLELVENLLNNSEKLDQSSPLMFLKESDIESRRDRLERAVRDRVRVYQCIYTIGCTDQSEQGISHLREEIIAMAKDERLFPKRILPESWQRLEDYLHDERKGTDHFMSYSKLTVTSMEDRNLEKLMLTGVDVALNYLHNLGELLKSIFRSNIDVFLDYYNYPAFAAAGFTEFRFIAAKKEFLGSGLVADDLLRVLWRDLNLTDEALVAMKELLKQFDLCFVAQEPARGASSENPCLVFPFFLSKPRPANFTSIWPDECPGDLVQLTYEIHFPTLCPPGLFECYQVRLNRLLKCTRTDWKGGTVATSNDAMLLLERKRKDHMVVIEVSLRAATIDIGWTWFMPVVNDLKAVLNHWPGVLSQSFFLCPHCVIENCSHTRKYPGEILQHERPIEGNVICHNDEGEEVNVDLEMTYPPPKQLIIEELPAMLDALI